MKSIVAFFAIMFAIAAIWTIAPKSVRDDAIQVARRFLPAIILAAAATVCLLGFAFFTTGKVI